MCNIRSIKWHPVHNAKIWKSTERFMNDRRMESINQRIDRQVANRNRYIFGTGTRTNLLTPLHMLLLITRAYNYINIAKSTIMVAQYKAGLYWNAQSWFALLCIMASIPWRHIHTGVLGCAVIMMNAWYSTWYSTMWRNERANNTSWQVTKSIIVSRITLKVSTDKKHSW